MSENKQQMDDRRQHNEHHDIRRGGAVYNVNCNDKPEPCRRKNCGGTEEQRKGERRKRLHDMVRQIAGDRTANDRRQV